METDWISRQLLDDVGRELMRLRQQRWATRQATVLDQSAFKILHQLDAGGSRTLAQLSQILRLDQSTVNRQVNAALTRGLLSREREPGSAGMMICPSPAGREALAHDSQILLSVFTDVLGEIGAEVGLRLADDLRRLNDAMDHHFDG